MPTSHASRHGSTRYDAAAARGLFEHVQVLLETGADAGALDHAGRTVLECLALTENGEGADKIRLLLQSG